MKCSMCGGENAAGVQVCGFCGSPLGAAPPSANPFGDQPPQRGPSRPGAPQEKLEDNLGVRMLIPVGRSVHAIIAGYLGLISLACCPLGPLAVLFGVLAIFDIRKNPKKGGIVRAILGIVLGLLSSAGLVLWIIVMIGEAANQ